MCIPHALTLSHYHTLTLMCMTEASTCVRGRQCFPPLLDLSHDLAAPPLAKPPNIPPPPLTCVCGRQCFPTLLDLSHDLVCQLHCRTTLHHINQSKLHGVVAQPAEYHVED